MNSQRREFLKSVGVLAGGAALAHGITAAALPVLSRLYSPADFSALAVFAGLMSVCSVAAALRFDLAVPIAERDHDALNLAVMGIAFSIAVAALLTVGVWLGGSAAAAALNQPRLAGYLWLLPLGVALSSTYGVLQYWYGRRGQFRRIANSRLVQSAASAGAQITLGLVPLAPFGLLAGHVTNAGAACVWLGGQLYREARAAGGAVSVARMRELFVEYRRFPTYSTVEALANAASMHVPTILIARFAAGPEAGYVMLAMTVMQAPMSLVGAAVGQVYVSQAATAFRNGTLGRFTAETTGQLLRLGVGPLVAAGIAAPFGFALVFGAEWERAGTLIAWMTPWFVLQFLSVPVGLALHVTGHQPYALALQAGGLALRVLAVVLAASWAADRLPEAYALSGMVFYLAYLTIVLRVVGASGQDVLAAVRGGLPIVAAWAALGVLVAFLLSLVTGN